MKKTIILLVMTLGLTVVQAEVKVRFINPLPILITIIFDESNTDSNITQK